MKNEKTPHASELRQVGRLSARD